MRQRVCLYAIASQPTQGHCEDELRATHLSCLYLCMLSLPSLIFLFSLSTHVCIVEGSNVYQKCVCIQIFEEEGSLCTFSVRARTCERSLLCKTVYFAAIYEWRRLDQGFQLWGRPSVRMVQRFSLRRQYSKVS